MICQSIDTSCDDSPQFDIDAANHASEVVTHGKAKFIQRTLGFKCALGYCRTRVGLDTTLYWLLGRGLHG